MLRGTLAIVDETCGRGRVCVCARVRVCVCACVCECACMSVCVCAWQGCQHYFAINLA